MDAELRRVFFHLLQTGLWGQMKLSRNIILNAEDWQKIYQQAITHTVEGIIYDSFSFLSDQQLPPPKLRLKWAVRVDQIERNNAKMNQVIGDQYQEFRNNGLYPILQKGQGVAQAYRLPNHRVCGDIDWYFENDGYKAARSFIKQKSISVQDTKGYSLNYAFNDQFVEHHSQLFDIRNPFKQHFLKTLENKYRDRYDTLKLGSLNIHLLAPEIQLLQVTAHILKHLISFGMGLRQFCDVANLYIFYFGKIDCQALKNIYKEAGILKWIHVLHQVLVDEIGLPKEYLPFEVPTDTTSDWMLEEIWHGGNFGYYDERYIDGKIIKAISVHPSGGKRLWHNFKRYFRYAPHEVLFFPIMHLYGKIFGIDRDSV